MKLDHTVWQEIRLSPGDAARLSARSTSGTQSLSDARAHRDLHHFKPELANAQELLYSTGNRALLIVLQGLDAAGKDGTIKHVMSGVNPEGCTVTSFKQPSAEELAHDFLWRCVIHLPRRGYMSLFNRSYYEDVLVVRIHPHWLTTQRNGSREPPPASFWHDRYDDINAFERHLVRNGTQVLKFYLHLSKEEQRRRLLSRLDDPTKQWKFSPADVGERRYWSDYQTLYEEVLSATSTEWAPWFVVPADDKVVSRALVAWVIVRSIEEMKLSPPEITPQDKSAMETARQSLLAE